MQRRCDRNRNRSKRRAIYCPRHHQLLDSISAKYPLYADQAGQLQARGMGRKTAMVLIANLTTVPLAGEWLEEFWCQGCQSRQWYHVSKSENSYTLSVIPPELWQQVTGAIDPHGNPSVSEFSRKQAKAAFPTKIGRFNQ
jgi:hypothetical protein